MPMFCEQGPFNSRGDAFFFHFRRCLLPLARLNFGLFRAGAFDTNGHSDPERAPFTRALGLSALFELCWQTFFRAIVLKF
jgi:hypothetical protein